MSSHHINFANGQPNDAVLPQPLVQRAAEAMFERLSTAKAPSTDIAPSSHPLNYGDTPSDFLSGLASFLSQSSLAGQGKEVVDPSLLVPTTGVSHGLDMICTMMCKKYNVQRGRPNTRASHFVFVEDGTYYLSSSIFKDYGLEVRVVKTDEEGIVVTDLEAQLEQCRKEAETKSTESPHQYPLFLYTIPLFNNPTGRCITPSRKKHLLEVTRKHDLLIVSDEVYQILDASNHMMYSQSSPSDLPPLRSLISYLDLPPSDGNNAESCIFPSVNNILVVSSFSKILAPGLRVGWIQCSTAQQREDLWGLGLMRSGSSSCHFTSCLVAQLLQPLALPPTPFSCLIEQQILSLCAGYASKYEALTQALLTHSSCLLKGGAGGELFIEGFRRPDTGHVRARVGGYFIFVRLPDWCSASTTCISSFYTALKDADVTVRAGSECTGNGKGNEEYIRLCFARLAEEDLREGARRLCQVLADLYKQHDA